MPLRASFYGGLVIAAIAVLYALFIIGRVLIFGIDTPGYASLLIAVLALGAIQLVSIGIIGEYLGRLFLEVKGRPIYVVEGVYEENSRRRRPDGPQGRGHPRQQTSAGTGTTESKAAALRRMVGRPAAGADIEQALRRSPATIAAHRRRLGSVIPVPADVAAEDVLFLEVHQAVGCSRFFVDAFDDVDRPALHLEEQAAEIFADDADRHQLDARPGSARRSTARRSRACRCRRSARGR